MRLLFSAILAIVFAALAAATFAQSTPTPAAVPLAVGKRLACKTASQRRERTRAKRSDATLHGAGSP
jgi:hypothetical protein